MKRKYEKGEITAEQFNSYQMIRSIDEEDWKEIEEDYKNGKIGEEEFNAMKQIRELPEDWRTLENGAKGIFYGVTNGVWEGVQWYVGGKLAGWTIKGGSQLASSAIRVGTDTGFNALDTPFRAGIDALTSDQNFQQAWLEQGGWQSLLINTGVGLVGSVGGELWDGIKLKNESKGLNSNEINKNFIDDFNDKFPNSLDNGSRKLNDTLQAAEYFSDPKGFLANKIGLDKLHNMTEVEIYDYASKILKKENDFKILGDLHNKGIFSKIHDMTDTEIYDYATKNLSQEEFGIFEKLYRRLGANEIRYMTDTEIYDYATKNLSKENLKDFKNLYKNRRKLSQEESDLILAFAAAGGPAIDAYCRGAETHFGGGIFNGRNFGEMNDYFKRSVNFVGKSSTLGELNIDDAVRMLDNIIENSKPLTESLVVTRYVDDIFKDGDRILNPRPGMIFNDKAFLSTSATGGVFNDRFMKLEIEVPAGSKVAYIEPNAIAHTGLGQQEVLLGRNNMYQIVDVFFDENTGQYTVKAQLIPTKSSIQSVVDSGIADNNKLYYNNYKGKLETKQVDLSDVIKDMNSKGLMAKYEAEVRDMKMSGIYTSAIAGHGEEHIEDVIFNAMYIAEKENFDKTEKKLLIEAAKYHDAGKEVEGHLHGIQGAENAINYLDNFCDDDIAIIQAAIEYHSIPDNNANLNEIFEKYRVNPMDRDLAEKVANALKDADALDRSRYPGNLNEKYLRTDSAKTLVQASHQLQEIKGRQFLNNCLASDMTDADKTLIKQLRKSGISDYEIAFWIQYQPSNVGGVIGVWQSINNKINLLIGG